jgi:ubiquinone/menaquinone biosynthesis C-methylase UbiE
MNFIKQNKEVYNKIAKLFSKTRKFLWYDLEPLVKYTKNGDKILDLGCGNGRLYQLFQGLSIEYIGVDQSEGQIETAREKYPDLDFKVAEMRDLPFEDDFFDNIYCIATFHHLPDEKTRLEALAEMKRVLKSGGRIMFTNWNLHSKSAGKYVEKGKWKIQEGSDSDFLVPWLTQEGEVLGERYYYGFKFDELEKLFEKADLKLEEQYYTKKGKKSSLEEGNNIVSVVIN